MKTCYMCGGDVKRGIVDVEVKGVIVKDVPVEVCTRCGKAGMGECHRGLFGPGVKCCWPG